MNDFWGAVERARKDERDTIAAMVEDVLFTLELTTKLNEREVVTLKSLIAAIKARGEVNG